ncbi:hypothetical protein COOONC_18811, partial [Cooperia oncophora]
MCQPTVFRLVKEVLSLRQRIYRLTPNFITNKRLHEMCGVPKDSRRIQTIEQQLLRTALRTKRDQMYACLKKCVAKEISCERIVPKRLWQRITRLKEKFDRLVDQQRCRRSKEVTTGNPSNTTIPHSSND